DVEGIRASIGADSLGYVSLDGLVAASEQPPNRLCRACFDGQYPIPLPAPELVGKHVLEDIGNQVRALSRELAGQPAMLAPGQPRRRTPRGGPGGVAGSPTGERPVPGLPVAGGPAAGRVGDAAGVTGSTIGEPPVTGLPVVDGPAAGRASDAAGLPAAGPLA